METKLPLLYLPMHGFSAHYLAKNDYNKDGHPNEDHMGVDFFYFGYSVLSY
jgi:hypothetical protein